MAEGRGERAVDGNGRLVRYVGIDFGTSSSVVAYKDYLEDPRGVDAREPAEAGDARIVQDDRSPVVPTVVYRRPDGDFVAGPGALDAALGEDDPSRLCREFKLDLVRDSNEQARAEAEQLTRVFLRHLWELYDGDATQLHSQRVDEQRTLVSFPASWPQRAQELMVAAAQDAGFPNVQGMREPEAAMRYFTAVESSAWGQLRQQGVIKDGRPLTVLLIDMGAGTTDLVLCTYVPGEDKLHDDLLQWPPVNQQAEPGSWWNVSGGEMDRLLLKEVIEPLVPESAADWQRLVLSDQIRPWKEHQVARPLAEGKPADQAPPYLNDLIKLAGGTKPVLGLDRQRYEQTCQDYLERYQQMITELLHNATSNGRIKTAEDIELVILTGGHSNWYWAHDLLTRQTNGTQPLLPTIAREPHRILKGPHPQETVARGLAMTGMPPTKPPVPKPAPKPRVPKSRPKPRVAANDAWVKIDLRGRSGAAAALGATIPGKLLRGRVAGKKQSVVVASVVHIQEAGEVLPRECEFAQRFTVPRSWAGLILDEPEPVVGTCTLYVGGRQTGDDVIGAERWSSAHCTLSDMDFRTFLAACYPKKWGVLDGSVDSGRLFVTVNVSESEEFVVRGVIAIGGSDAYVALDKGGQRELSSSEKAVLDRKRKAVA